MISQGYCIWEVWLGWSLQPRQSAWLIACPISICIQKASTDSVFGPIANIDPSSILRKTLLAGTRVAKTNLCSSFWVYPLKSRPTVHKFSSPMQTGEYYDMSYLISCAFTFTQWLHINIGEVIWTASQLMSTETRHTCITWIFFQKMKIFIPNTNQT